MERVSNLSPKVTLSNYRQLIEKFLPFVLIRCTRFTNSKRIAETIAVYTFVCSYVIARMPEKKAGLPVIIRCMADIIGEDLGSGNTLNSLLLFKWEDDLRFARRLAQMGTKECLDVVARHKDFVARNLNGVLLDRITDSVMDYLLRQN